MYSSLSISKRLTLPSILVVVAIQLLLTCSVSCLNMTNAYLHHKCYATQGKYKSGSVYEKELTRITHNIPSTNGTTIGYENISFGGENNFVSVILQCPGDSYGSKCRSCYATALSELRRRCLKYKGGIVWYDQCLLEFSATNTTSEIDYENNFCMHNTKNVIGDTISFEDKVINLLDNLTSIAIKKEFSDPTSLYAAGVRSFGTFKLYGMVQCAKDLGKKGCEDCFAYHLLHYQDCFRGKQGGRVLGKSCDFRFELYPFVSNYLKM